MIQGRSTISKTVSRASVLAFLRGLRGFIVWGKIKKEKRVRVPPGFHLPTLRNARQNRRQWTPLKLGIQRFRSPTAFKASVTRKIHLNAEVINAKIPAYALDIIRTLQDRGHQAYIVGGAIRDILMDRPLSDCDICTSALPQEVQEIFPKVIPTGIAHGTVTVRTRKVGVEVTTLRIEGGYTDSRRPDRVSYTTSLEEDLRRRDFTINAMAWDPIQKHLHDPYGGIRDLEKGVIRAVGKAFDRFSEDGMRSIRAARFSAQLNFVLDPQVQVAMTRTLEVTSRVSGERFRDELLKIMTTDKPSIALQIMQDTGLLNLFIPELSLCQGIDQNQYHAWDVFTHTLHVVDELRGPPLLRLAALFHDIGKRPTWAYNLKRKEHQFFEHEVAGAKMTREIMRRLKFGNPDITYVVHLVRNHMFFYQSRWTDASVRRFIRKIGQDNIEDLFFLREADKRGSGKPGKISEGLTELRRRIKAMIAGEGSPDKLNLALDGREVMEVLGIPEGVAVGRALEFLMEKVLDDASINTPEQLRALLKEFQ